MGKPDIKYGDSMVFIQHCETGRWLSYQTYETKKRGVGKLEVKKVSSYRDKMLSGLNLFPRE